MKTGIELISEERQRQIEVEGWTSEHDDKHSDGSLAMAAASYCVAEDMREAYGSTDNGSPATLWPWAEEWWKPTPDDRVRELVKAGALIAAEIDRLQRLNKPKLNFYRVDDYQIYAAEEFEKAVALAMKDTGNERSEFHETGGAMPPDSLIWDTDENDEPTVQITLQKALDDNGGQPGYVAGELG